MLRPLAKIARSGAPSFLVICEGPAPPGCHSEAVESLAKPRTPNEGSVHSGGDVARGNCIDPSAHKRRGPQDDSVDGGEGAGVRRLKAPPSRQEREKGRAPAFCAEGKLGPASYGGAFWFCSPIRCRSIYQTAGASAPLLIPFWVENSGRDDKPWAGKAQVSVHRTDANLGHRRNLDRLERSRRTNYQGLQP
jgi:hypothetical protein